MARADTTTLIPLDRLAWHLQIDPYHFNQIYSANRPVVSACDDMWYQHDWQASGRLSRESLAMALKQAETVVSEYLLFSPLPTWFEETHQIPSHYRTEVLYPYNSNNRARSITTNRGFVTQVGRRSSTLVAAAAPTFFDDDDGDSYDERVTISFPTTVTEEEELRVYYPNKAGREEWEIRPLTDISISGGVATITFPRYLIPLEPLLEVSPTPTDPHIGIDGDNIDNFLAEVDVYRVFSDPSEHAYLLYSSSGCATPPCEDTSESACLSVRDSRLGMLAFARADWDEDAAQYAYTTCEGFPDRITVYYRAGKQDPSLRWPSLQMDRTLERMICYYALSLLDTEVCGCSNTRNIWEYQTRDLGAEKPEGTRYVVPWALLGNPLGTTFAAVRLWQYIQPMRLAKAPFPR